MMPGGDFYPTLIRKSPIKPIRIFLQDGENDLSNLTDTKGFKPEWTALANEHGNWHLHESGADARRFGIREHKRLTARR